MIDQRYYAPNPETPIFNKLLCILMGIVIVFFLAFAHGVITFWNPIVYLGFIVTIGFGLVFGILYRVISKIAKVRDSKFILYSGLGVLLLGMYFSWGAYLLMLAEEPMEYFPTLGMLLSPDWMFRTIGDLYTYGSWGFSNNSTVNGPILGGIWLGEILIVLYMGFKVLYNYQVDPFSERFNKWFIKYRLDNEYQSLADPHVFFEKEGATITDKIGNLGRGNATRYGRISIFYLENAGEAYLLYENVGRDSKGKKESATTVIDYLIIPKAEAAQLLKSQYGKKEFYFVY